EESAGVKFADADLIGIPYRAVIGRTFDAEGLVELQERATGEKTLLGSEELLSHLEHTMGSAPDMGQNQEEP
ncbi:MAG: His/Gly/Thr/Pro-type tRNA ligase C-terminal domain-containing protein, partial [Actinomycetota bacterium]|nr:His/Gly/Thr/Pro-type tRNA ligase C-terminal domain-containing protein [Actinomycetota bacterium]